MRTESVRAKLIHAAELRRDELITDVLAHYQATEREIMAGGMCTRRDVIMAREEIIRVLDLEFVFSSGVMGQIMCMSRESATMIRKRIDNNPGREWKLVPRVMVQCDQCGGSGTILVEGNEARRQGGQAMNGKNVGGWRGWCRWLAAVVGGLISTPVMGQALEELKALKQLPDNPPTYLWSTPNAAVPEEVVQVGRICGSVGIDAKEKPETIAKVVGFVAQAQALRAPNTRPVALTVILRPWFIDKGKPPIDPTSDAAWREFGILTKQIKDVTAALPAPRPPIVAMIDAEGLDCIGSEAKKTACKELYATYDLIVQALLTATREWYGFGAVPAPALPDEFGYHFFAAPFPGMQSLGWEWYYTEEAIGRRESSRRARTYAMSLGIARTTVWISIGCGRKFQFTPEYSIWINDAGTDTSYSAQLGRELYGKWYRARPTRYMDPVDAVCVYPHPLDSDMPDKSRRHAIALWKAATE